MEAFLNGRRRPFSRPVLRKCASKGHHRTRRLQPCPVRLFVQEQGCATGARRGCRLPSGARPTFEAIKTVDADGNPVGERKCFGRRAVLGAGLQGDQRCLRRAHVRARLLGCIGEGRFGSELDSRQAREDRPHGGNVRQGSQPDRRGARGRHHRSRVAWQRRRPAIRCAIRPPRWCWSACAFPNPSSACRSSPKTRPNRKSSARHSARWFAPIPRCTWKPIARPVRPSCVAWASCIWK